MKNINTRILNLDNELFSGKTDKYLIDCILERETKSYLVGGGVRDLLLGNALKDIDILIIDDVTNGIENLKKDLEKKDFQISILQINEHYRTAKVLIKKNNELDLTEQSTMDLVFSRKEVYHSPASKPEISSGTFEEDILRRDFSINALAITKNDNYKLVDIVNGSSDLEASKLRVLHPESFVDDPVRILRGERFLTRFNLTWEEQTSRLRDEAINKNYLSLVSPGRLFAEFDKVLLEKEVWKIVQSLSNDSILLQIFKTGMYNADLNKKLIKRLVDLPASIDLRLANWALFIRSYFYDLLGNIPEDFFHLIPATKLERAEIKSIAISL